MEEDRAKEIILYKTAVEIQNKIKKATKKEVAPVRKTTTYQSKVRKIVENLPTFEDRPSSSESISDKSS
jgi:hypothetical protein